MISVVPGSFPHTCLERYRCAVHKHPIPLTWETKFQTHDAYVSRVVSSDHSVVMWTKLSLSERRAVKVASHRIHGPWTRRQPNGRNYFVTCRRVAYVPGCTVAAEGDEEVGFCFLCPSPISLFIFPPLLLMLFLSFFLLSVIFVFPLLPPFFQSFPFFFIFLLSWFLFLSCHLFLFLSIFSLLLS